jgi:hypothetical protein
MNTTRNEASTIKKKKTHTEPVNQALVNDTGFGRAKAN